MRSTIIINNSRKEADSISSGTKKNALYGVLWKSVVDVDFYRTRYNAFFLRAICDAVGFLPAIIDADSFVWSALEVVHNAWLVFCC